MPFPTPIVEVAFTDGPYVVSPTWTDVTQYVRSASVDRGVSDDWQLVADGSATVVFNNRDRRFDPFNTSSPYWDNVNNRTNLVPRRQIRIRATAGGTTYDVFRGFVAGWPPAWTDAGYDSTVTVSCFDALQLLGSSSLPADWSRSYILSTNPRHYYPCDEPIQPFTAGQTVKDYGTFPLDFTTTTAASEGPELAVGLPSRSLQGTEGNAVTSSVGPVLAGTIDISFACWAIFDGGASGSLGYSLGNAGAYITFDVATSKYQVVVSDNYSGLIRTYTTVNTYDSGTARFFAFSWNATSKALTLWIDGVVVATTATTAGAIIVITGESVGFNSAQAQCVIGWQGILSTTTVQNIYNYSSANFPETTTARFNRVVGQTPFNIASLTSTPASPASSVLDITNDAPSVSSELAKIADSEYGQMFVNKAGTLTLYQQNQIRTQTKSIVSQQTYGSGGLGIGQDVEIQYDGDSMRNIANIEMSGGGVYIQTASSSVNSYGQAEQYVSTQVSNLPDAVDIANIVDGWGSQVYPKISPVQVVVSPDASWGSTLGLELWDRVTFVVAPPTGSAITVRSLVSRITHNMSPGLWSTTLEGSARWAAVFIVGQSTIGGTDLLA